MFALGYGGGDCNARALRQIAEANGGEFVEGTVDSIRRRREALQPAF